MNSDRPQKTARVKAMDYLARRDHSEKELREKLKKNYSQEEIDAALKELTDRGWLLPPQELTEKVTQNLHSKKKGFLYIQNFLRQKGLPEATRDGEVEFQKAMELVESRVENLQDHKRLASLLKNRGFDTETISRVIYEIRRTAPSVY